VNGLIPELYLCEAAQNFDIIIKYEERQKAITDFRGGVFFARIFSARYTFGPLFSYLQGNALQ
jgi:hypothetical protein